MSTLERIGVRKAATVSRAAAALLLAGVGAGVVFGFPAPSGGVEPLADPQATIRPIDAADAGESAAPAVFPVDFEFTAQALMTTSDAPQPPEEPETPGEGAGEPTEPVAQPENVGGADVRYVGGLRGGSVSLAVLRINGRERVVRAGQTVEGVELISADAESAEVRVGGESRRLRLGDRSGPAVSRTVGTGGNIEPTRAFTELSPREQELERRRQNAIAQEARQRAESARQRRARD